MRYPFLHGAPVAAHQPLLQLQALKRLERGWDALAIGRASPMQHYAWAEAFAGTFWDAGSVHVTLVGADDAPSAVAALVRSQPSSGWESLGVRQLFEPADFLYEHEEALMALVQALRAQGEALYLPRVPADSPTIGILCKVYGRRGFVRVARTDGYPVLELDARWMEPERGLNPGRRSDFRRASRRAERYGRTLFEVRSPTPEELPPLLDEAWRVEGAGWKGGRGSALNHDRLRGAFFRRFAAVAARKGILRLAFMRIDGRAVAMQLAVECAGRLWLLKIGHDELFARCSPGQQLMLHVAGDAARRGLSAIEFLGEDEAWTRMWTQTTRACVAVRAYPLTAGGVATLANNVLRYVRRQTKYLGSTRAPG